MRTSGWLALAAGLTGCVAYQDRDAAVWSDDGEAVAAWHIRMRCDPTRGRDYCDVLWAELVVDDLPLLERVERRKRSALLQQYTDRGFALHYMRDRGYVLVDWAAGRFAPEAEVVAYDAVTGDVLWTIPDADAVAPSPDGAFVAAIDRKTTDDGGGAYVVSMYDADDGAGLWVAEVPFDAPDPNHPRFADPLYGDQGHTWTPDGALLLQSSAGPGPETALTVDGERSRAPSPACWFPVTTSSPWDASGQGVLADNALVLPGWPVDHEGFGCQQATATLGGPGGSG